MFTEHIFLLKYENLKKKCVNSDTGRSNIAHFVLN